MVVVEGGTRRLVEFDCAVEVVILPSQPSREPVHQRPPSQGSLPCKASQSLACANRLKSRFANLDSTNLDSRGVAKAKGAFSGPNVTNQPRLDRCSRFGHPVH